MKQTVRNNIFETNSSSMHSLVISKKAKPYSVDAKKLYYYGYDFELFGCCDTHSFGRTPFEVLSSPKDKLRYYVAHYVGFKKQKEKLKEVEDLVHELTGCPRKKIKLYCEEEYPWKKKPEKSYGYAGVNDTGEDVFDYIEKNNVPLREFILDPRYTVVVDGDEYQEFKKLFEKGIIDLDNIDYISSGKHFWLDDIKTFSLYYINQFVNDSVYNEFMEEIDNYNNEFIKCIEIEDEEDIDINQSAMITFASVLECFRHLTYGRNIPIKLILKNHNEKDYEPIMKFIDSVESAGNEI